MGNSNGTLSGPADGVFAITPGASELAIWTRAIRANTAGTVTIEGADGVSCVCNFLAGETRSIRAKKVTAATATGLEGMY